jgi:hypothetical protein
MSNQRPSPIWLLVPLVLVACGSDSPPRPKDDRLPPGDACQAGPGELPRPPAGSLPCELLPPGFQLAGNQ